MGTPSVSAIKHVVAAHYGLSVRELDGDRRSRHIARPRQVAMYLAVELTGLSYPRIGSLIGNRDHTTILHGVRAIRKLLHTDPDLAGDIQKICKVLTLRTGKSLAPFNSREDLLDRAFDRFRHALKATAAGGRLESDRRHL